MKPLFGKEFAKIIEKHDWILLRIQGSHHIYGKPDSVVRLSVPIHGNAPLKMGLFKHLLKMSGLQEGNLD